MNSDLKLPEDEPLHWVHSAQLISFYRFTAIE